MNSLRLFSLALVVLFCGFARPKATHSMSAPAPNEPKVWVQRADGSLQCGGEERAPVTLEETTRELKDLGLQVFQSVTAHDGKMRAQMCGLPTGKVIRVQILARDEAKAIQAGFEKFAQMDSK
jgi:hypothetical protein